MDHRLLILLGSDIELVLRAPVRLSTGPMRAPDAVVVELFPAQQDVARVLQLYGAKVVSAVAFKSGALRIVFDNAMHLYCPPDPVCEAWHCGRVGQWACASLPGGGLTVCSEPFPCAQQSRR